MTRRDLYRERLDLLQHRIHRIGQLPQVPVRDPGLFAEAVWLPAFDSPHRDSARDQVSWCVERLAQLPSWQRLFLYVNVSATHTPHAHYLPGATHDSVESQQAALAQVDRELPRLIDALRRRPHPTHAHLEMTLGWIDRARPRRAILTNMHVDLDYETLAAETPEHITPAHDGLSLEFDL